MKKLAIITLFLGAFMTANILTSSPAHALCPQPTSQSDSHYTPHCGIWLCMPGGFPGGCGPQKSAFKSRVSTRRCSSLPRWSSCFGNDKGSYDEGKAYKPCKEGYNLRVIDEDHGRESASCVSSTATTSGEGRDKITSRDSYSVTKKNYVDLTIDGTTYPRYWW